MCILDIDTLRPNHVGCYGYHRDTSPYIDAIAANGTRFTNIHALDVPCLTEPNGLVIGTFGILAADPHEPAGLGAYLERLRATGREHWITPILDRHAPTG